jgi:hypothetical protein
MIDHGLETNKNEEVARDRVLSERELLIVWNCLPATGDNYAELTSC